MQARLSILLGISQYVEEFWGGVQSKWETCVRVDGIMPIHTWEMPIDWKVLLMSSFANHSCMIL